MKGTCTRPSCDSWHPPECPFYKTESGCKIGAKCSYAHRQVEEQPGEKPKKKNGDSSAVAMVKDTRQLGCVFQDLERPKSSSILRKSTKVLKPIRRVQFSKATLRYANIRENKGPSVGVICPADLHQRSSDAQILRIHFKKRRRDKRDVPAKPRGNWPKIS